MVDLYSGTPGSGKSLHTASRLYYWLRLGRPAICNFELNLDKVSKNNSRRLKFRYVPNDQLTPEYLISYAASYWHGGAIKEEAILLVIDECQLMFNAREWDAKGRAKWLSFFTQHRKFGYHIILIAQFDRMIDRQIRSLIEYEYIHRKVSNYGLRGFLLSIFMGGHVYVAVKVWYPLKETIGHEFFRGRKKLFRLYDTYGSFGRT